MATRRKLDEAYMACARAIAALSHAKRKQVGAILVSGGIIAEGYNGTPSGFDNNCEDEVYWTAHGDMAHETQITKEEADVLGSLKWWSTLVTRPEVLHAESNAIAKVAKSTNSSLGATLYVTCSPCFECSKIIIQAGIKRVVYEEDYRLLDGLDLLRKANISVEKL